MKKTISIILICFLTCLVFTSSACAVNTADIDTNEDIRLWLHQEVDNLFKVPEVPKVPEKTIKSKIIIGNEAQVCGTVYTADPVKLEKAKRNLKENYRKFKEGYFKK